MTQVRLRAFFVITLIVASLIVGPLGEVEQVHAQSATSPASVLPATNPTFVGTLGNVKVSITKPGIAVRIEIPREFLPSWPENDTSFITSNIRNDYYYYSVVDEAQHWSYSWSGNVTDGPCFKPGFSLRDPNAPYCVEIWNYLNAPSLKPPDLTVDYCGSTQQFVFRCFSPPKFVLFRNLQAPTIAGIYNFTIFVANRTNAFGRPDFVHAWNTTQYVPVSLTYNPKTITGQIVDGDAGDRPVRAKGVVLARTCLQESPPGVCMVTGPVLARALVNPADGTYSLTGLDFSQAYWLQASAGLYNGVTYALSDPIKVGPILGAQSISRNVTLSQAVQLTGTIEYHDKYNNLVHHSFTNNSYLLAAGFKANSKFRLNITVEADVAFPVTQSASVNYVYRYFGYSTNSSEDTFTISTGNGTNYVGADPSGTQFAGLPDPSLAFGGNYSVTLRVWISGYVQSNSEQCTMCVQFSIKPSDMPRNTGSKKNVGKIVMRPGGFIAGSLNFENVDGTHESPATAAYLASQAFGVPLTSTTTLYGGNIIIEAFSHTTGLLLGMTVINGTLPNGTASYNLKSSIPFTIVGFSEYYNHSWSGVWDKPDSGLPDDSYDLKVFIRGYELNVTSPSPVSVGLPGNYGDKSVTVAVTMFRGGAFSVLVASNDNRIGTRAIQAQVPWRFLNLSIPIAARVYFCDPDCHVGTNLGYVERVMVTHFPNGVDLDSFTVLFAGMNPTLREIWFYGSFLCQGVKSYLGCPTHIGTSSTYSIPAFTLGYVPVDLSPPPNDNALSDYRRDYIPLFIGDEVDITVPVYLEPSTGVSSAPIPENDYPVGQVLSPYVALAGAIMANASAGTTLLDFPVFGFGGMTLVSFPLGLTWPYIVHSGIIVGQGHFFYEATDGTTYYDYGLDTGTYNAQFSQTSDSPCQVCVKGFGFKQHFMQVSQNPIVTFKDLNLEKEVFLQIYAMASVTQPLVLGYQDDITVSALSWALVTAIGSYTYLNYTYAYSGFTSTLDGTFDAENALQLPQGVYTITFSNTLYKSQSVSNVQVYWNTKNVTVTASVTLCPNGATFCDPPSAQSFVIAPHFLAQENTDVMRVGSMTRPKLTLASFEM